MTASALPARLANQQRQWRRANWLCRRSLQLGAIHAGRGEFAKAGEFYHRALATLRANPDPKLEVDALIQIADGDAWRGWFDQAECRLKQALAAAGQADGAAVWRVLHN